MSIKAYNVRLRKKEKIDNPKVELMKTKRGDRYRIYGRGVKSGDKLTVFVSEDDAYDFMDETGQKLRTRKKKSSSRKSRRKSSRRKSSGRKKSSGRRRKSSGRRKSGRKNSSGRKSYPKSKNCKKNLTKARVGKYVVSKSGRVVKADGKVGCNISGPFYTKAQAKKKAAARR